MADAALIAAPEAARILGITVARLYVLSREGVVPSVRLGRSFRYSPATLNEFIQRGGHAWRGTWKKIPNEVDGDACASIRRGAVR